MRSQILEENAEEAFPTESVPEAWNSASDTGEDETGNNTDQSPEGVLSWSLTSIKNLLARGEGKATHHVVQFVKRYMKGTRLIFVFGETGSGKTTLLGEIVNNKDLKAGHTIKSGTLGHEILPAIIHGKQYLFVDTPGFGAADLDDKRVFDDIMNCLFAIGPFVTVVGVLFVHNVQIKRLTASEMKTIRWLECFCGPKFYKNITIVMTQWDNIIPKRLHQTRSNVTQVAELALANILNPSNGIAGGRIYNHGIPGGGIGSHWESPLDLEDNRAKRVEEAANFIRDHYGNIDEIAALQIRVELDRGWRVYETEAAKSLFTPPESTTVAVLREKAIVLDLNEPIPHKPQNPGNNDPNWSTDEEEADNETGRMDWFTLIKQAAFAFMKYRTTQTLNVGEIIASVSSSVWEKLKNWWSGDIPIH